MFHEPWKRSWALIKKKKKGLYKKKKQKTRISAIAALE